MRLIRKDRMLFGDTSGESIVEVLVAFTLLAMMMLVFSQGIAFATTSEVNAKKSRDGADNAMIDLQKKLSSDNPTVNDGTVTVEQKATYDAGTGKVTTYKYTVDGTTYVVFMPQT
ncbi:MAG: hypothetical protein IKG30_06450 [Clostridiales bacterium]|nr:hypothetical protein [Clostridiales bacterium]